MKSVLTEYTEYCAFCGKPRNAEHHLLFGYGERQLSEEDGIKLGICDNCHTMNPVSLKIHGNPMAEKLSKMLGQMAWEKQKIIEGHDHTKVREEFRKRYGRSYL